MKKTNLLTIAVFDPNPADGCQSRHSPGSHSLWKNPVLADSSGRGSAI